MVPSSAFAPAPYSTSLFSLHQRYRRTWIWRTKGERKKRINNSKVLVHLQLNAILENPINLGLYFSSPIFLISKLPTKLDPTYYQTPLNYIISFFLFLSQLSFYFLLIWNSLPYLFYSIDVVPCIWSLRNNNNPLFSVFLFWRWQQRQRAEVCSVRRCMRKWSRSTKG